MWDGGHACLCDTAIVPGECTNGHCGRKAHLVAFICALWCSNRGGGAQVRDLLKESGGAQRLEIQNTRSSGTNVAGVQQVEVNNTQDVLDVMARGETNRATADTKMNERSSRSHSVLTVIVDGYNTITGALRCPCRALRCACRGAFDARCDEHARRGVSCGRCPLPCRNRGLGHAHAPGLPLLAQVTSMVRHCGP